jgi:hypothetical protein
MPGAMAPGQRGRFRILDMDGSLIGLAAITVSDGNGRDRGHADL